MKNILKIFALLFLISFCACNDDDDITGEGSTITRDFDELGNFQGVEIGIPVEVNISQTSTNAFSATGQENILNNLVFDLDREGVLHIRFDKHVSSFDGLVLEIGLTTLVKLEASGTVSITGTTAFRNLNVLEVELSGSSSMELDSMVGNEIEIDMTGTSKLNISPSVTTADIDMDENTQMTLGGMAQISEVDMSGNSTIEGIDFTSETLSVSLSGSSSLSITVNNNIQGETSGSSLLRYGGSPTTNVQSSGSSVVEAIN